MFANSVDRPGNNLLAIRILLAAVVVLSNSFLLANGVTDADPWKRFNHQQAILGHTAVDFFFILSGFLIADRLLRNTDLWNYFTHRVRRVYPGFLLAAVVSFLIVLPLGGGHLEAPAWLSARMPHAMGAGIDLLYRSLRLGQPSYSGAFLHNPYPADVNQSLWSISYGFGCYVLAALISVVRLRRHDPHLPGGLLRSPRLLTGALLLAVAVSIWFHVERYFPSPRWAVATIGYPAMWVRELPMFLGGLTLRSWMTQPMRVLRPTAPVASRDIRWLPRLAGIAALAILVSTQIPHGLGAVMPFAGPVLLIALAFSVRLPLGPIARLGDPSYGMYLLSFPLQQLVVSRWGTTLSPWLLFAFSLPLSLLAGYLSWHLVERWFLTADRAVARETIAVRKQRAA